MISSTSSTHQAQTSRFTLLLLAAVFILPFVVGSMLFLSGWRTEKTRQHGELLQPVIPLPASGLRHTDGRPLLMSQLHGKWLLIFPIKDSCNAECIQKLQQMLHVHLALNKEQSRLQRVLISNGVSPSGLASLQQEFPDLVIGVIPEGDGGGIWRQILHGHENDFYIADPFGNLMMRYDNPAPLQGVLKDLERVLKYSWVR